MSIGAAGIAGLRKHALDDRAAMRLEEAAKKYVSAATPGAGQCAVIEEKGAFAVVLMGVLNHKITGPMLQPLWAATGDTQMTPTQLRDEALQWFEGTLPNECDRSVREVMDGLRRVEPLVFRFERAEPTASASISASPRPSPIQPPSPIPSPAPPVLPSLARQNRALAILGVMQAVVIALLLFRSPMSAPPNPSTDSNPPAPAAAPGMQSPSDEATQQVALATYELARANQALLTTAVEAIVKSNAVLARDTKRCQELFAQEVRLRSSVLESPCRDYLNELSQRVKAPIEELQQKVKEDALPSTFDAFQKRFKTGGASRESGGRK